MDLYLKSEECLNGDFFFVNNGMFAITDRKKETPGVCEEYNIILKIKDNKNGYFDFNKSLIDIGSEDGNYAMLLDFNKNYCFEPNKQMCCLIYTNMYLKGKEQNTEVYNIALSDEDGKPVLFNGFSDSSSPLFPITTRCKEEKIVTRTLDSYNIKNVGLIKIDTEGFDYFVLKGGINTIIENNYPPILFENWDVESWPGWTQEKHDRINDFLKSIGYTIFEHWGDHETHLAVKPKNTYIVSMTTIPCRQKYIKESIKSLLSQSFKFDKLVINIDDNLTEDDYSFYNSLTDIDERIEINVCEHKWRSCNKLLPTIKKYPDSVIITVDDDMDYPNKSIETLVIDYEKNKDCIITLASNPVIMGEGRYCGYALMDDVCFKQKCYSKYMSNCCLFPPHVFDETDLFDYDKMIECTNGEHDELWFWVNSTLKEVKVIVENNYLRNIENYALVKDGEYRLGDINLNFDRINQYTDAIRKMYGDKIDKILSDKIEFVLTCDNLEKFYYYFALILRLYEWTYCLNVENLPKGKIIDLRNFLSSKGVAFEDVVKQ